MRADDDPQRPIAGGRQDLFQRHFGSAAAGGQHALVQVKADDRLQERLRGDVDRHVYGHVWPELGGEQLGHQE